MHLLGQLLYLYLSTSASLISKDVYLYIIINLPIGNTIQLCIDSFNINHQLFIINNFLNALKKSHVK
jgi:hypothetical protein